MHQATNFAKAEAGLLRPARDGQSPDRTPIELPPAAYPPRRRQDSDCLIVADGRRAESGLARKLGDGHGTDCKTLRAALAFKWT
jgi:hypothetical protein